MSKKEFNKNFKKKSLRNNSKKSILYGIFTFFAVVSVIILSVFAVKLIKYGKDILSPSEKNILNDSDDVFLDLTDDDTNNNGDDIADKFVQENDGNINNDVSNMDELQNTDDSNTDVIDNINTEIKNDSNNGASDKKNEDIPIKEDKNDPQHENSEGIVIDVRDIEKAKDETDEITFGIDVSKWQGIIDWKEVKDAGVEFAIIRIGYRTQVDGKIIEDPYARYNLQQAQKYGIKLGAYFFSTAVNEKEAKEEAKWVVDFLAPYKITYPVVYNCEGFTDPENRQY